MKQIIASVFSDILVLGISFFVFYNCKGIQASAKVNFLSCFL